MNLLNITRLGVVGLLVLTAGPAWAQYQLGTGRALDRNLQRGSGGINAPARRNTAGQYQDAIVTGNVGGLARFRGNIDYRAAGEFSGPTAGDITYNFNRQSLPTVPVTPYQQRRIGERGEPINPLINPETGTGTALIRPGSGTKTGQIYGGHGWYDNPNIAARPDDASSPISRRYGDAIDADRSLAWPFEETTIRGDRPPLGVTTLQDGRLLEVTASPLAGLRSRVLETQPAGINQLYSRESPLSGDADPATPESAQGADASEADESSAPPERVNRRVDPSVLQGQRVGEPRETAAISTRRTGQRLRTDALTPEQEAPQPPNYFAAEPGQDVYADLLRRIDRESGRGEDQLTITPPAADGAAPMTEAEKIAKRFAQIRKGEGAGAAGESMADRVDYDLPPLQSLAGEAGTAFNQVMAQAEAKMQSGRYFEADALYRRALTLRPGYPLAMVGRIHAQLSAGMLRSAAINLRQLLTHHPELIAARYTQPLLPDAARLREIEDQLQSQGEGGAQSDAALLLAYLAYQQGRPGAVDQALTSLRESSPTDSLVGLLRRVWGRSQGSPVGLPPSSSQSPDIGLPQN